ncbi:MAG: DUF1801 domain-containing protein [Planctomycetes bacterium]|nr:DUF1801 domain-containing protein [Planctomycetota bacterium]
MAELKTKMTDASVAAYMAAISDEKRRADCETVLALMRSVTRDEPKMWGTAIVGFGRYFYRYASGQEGYWMLTAFANRAQAITLYIMAGFDRYADLMARLGKYKTGKSCLYVRRLEDIDLKVLKELVTESVRFLKAKEKETLAAGGPKPVQAAAPKAAKKAGGSKGTTAAGKKATKKAAAKKKATKKAAVKKPGRKV